MIMLDTNNCLSFELSPHGSPPMGDDVDMEKAGLKMDHDRHVYHSLKEVLQLKLQQRRTREELVSQGIMPPLKSPAAFHEQRRLLERARTEDYLKRKIRCRPERSELVRMHILEETLAEPSLQAKQLQLKRARLADNLNDKISHRPGPIELVHKNILSVTCSLQHSLLDSPKGAGGESSSLDEDSSDALSPDQPTNHDSPLSAVPQLSPPDALTQKEDISPTQFVTQAPPPPPPQGNGCASSPPPKLTNGTMLISASPRSTLGQVKARSSDRPPQRTKKTKDNKPKVKKLKYHQYIPPDQKADKELPPPMDSSYAKLLHQQQLFLQLQILSQQQQHYNYHTILPAPPKPPAEQSPTVNSGPSPSRSAPSTTTPAPSNQSTAGRQSQTAVGGAKPSTLPANLDEFKVAELKQELKLRGLTVSGTKNDLIERLRNYQEQNGGNAAVLKNAILQQAANSTASTSTSSPTTTAAPDHQLGESGFKLALSSLAHAVPGRVMRFGSTSSSPPMSPTPSERSLAGMSPDETSCNGDMFGEMVSSPLTQLTLHPSPQPSSNISPLSQPLSQVKEEMQSTCSQSTSSAASSQRPEPLSAGAMDSSSMDKDQMLQEKDKQIEELTKMLRQKQRLVETLRSQLEQGKVTGGVVVKREGIEKSKSAPEAKLPTLIKASAIQPPTLPNGTVVKVKREVESEEEMEGVTEEAQSKKLAQPMQCSQETLLRLQQIQRLQAEQQKQLQPPQQQQSLAQPQKVAEAKSNPQKQQQQKKEAQILLQQQQQLQQLIIQQTQQKQLQAQQKLAQQKLAQQKLAQQKPVQQSQLKQPPGQVQQSQPKNQVQLKQVQVQIQNQTVASQKPATTQIQQRKQLRAQQRQQQKQQTAAVATQQVAPVFINQQNSTPMQTQAISLDVLKANGTPTLVTDSNGNHYLIALTSPNTGTGGQNGVSPLAKTNGRITLQSIFQRLLSTPSKLPSSDSQSKEQVEAELVSEPIKKGQKAGLHLDTNGVPQPSLSVTAPPNLQPFFDDMSESESQSNLISSLKREELCPPYDRHTLFTPPSPKPNTSLPLQRSKENGVNSQQMDDLFDILLKSGEIPGFKSNPDPSLAPLHSNPPSPSSPPSPLHLSPPTPTEPLISPQPCTGGGRLEDFLESTTGAPLLGVEPDGALTLIDDLHSQMLSTPSILDHPPTPMDTSDLGFSPHSTGLDFGDPTLDSMDWLDISMVGSSSGGSGGGRGGSGGGGGAGEGDGGTSLAPLAPHTPPSVFSADFLDSTDLQLHWESCL
ncbi:myocardin related transcription factor Ab isoform X15 [Paralichthys olivaceus]|uniref:myocardin related transcription factor Ab isoform X15 n=1 Tax=Paralichthys olivaceus TaxID=8255 RepID=UPI0037517AE0